MNFVLRPWQLLLLILAGWINRDQQDAIEYLLTENQVLREKLGKRRILLNDDQRRRVAVKGKVPGPKKPRQTGQDRQARHASALAARAYRSPVGSLRQEAIRWPTTHSTTDCGLGSAHGSGES